MDSNKYSIRHAVFDDAKQIFDLIKDNPHELLARPISDIVQNIDRFVVCTHDDEVVGSVSWSILPEVGTKDASVEIKSLAITKDHRKEGIGTALVKKVITYIEVLHPAEIIALTFEPEFFKKLGFVETSKETLLHKIYMGCINCTKYDSPSTCPEIAMVLAL